MHANSIGVCKLSLGLSGDVVRSVVAGVSLVRRDVGKRHEAGRAWMMGLNYVAVLDTVSAKLEQFMGRFFLGHLHLRLEDFPCALGPLLDVSSIWFAKGLSCNGMTAPHCPTPSA
jgi:hypothetical protein